MKKEYNKLVRDLIPQIIENSGNVCITEVLSGKDYFAKLVQKLDEEVAEYRKNYAHEELADILEVVYALAKATGCSEEKLNAMRANKTHARGGFSKKILLKSVEENQDFSFLFKMKAYLDEQGLLYSTTFPEFITQRQKGKFFSFEEHLKGLIYALLSAQVPWHRIVPHLHEIDQLFFNYDTAKILSHSPTYYIEGIKAHKCASRCTNRQMQHLHDNICVLQRIVSEYGSIDAYITSKNPETIVHELSSGCYKLFGIGPALAWEYLRNVGIDGTKPDVHICRFLGKDRIGFAAHSSATTDEAIEIVKVMSRTLNISMVEIDSIIWSFCATGYGNICSANPKCGNCVIREYCNKHR